MWRQSRDSFSESLKSQGVKEPTVQNQETGLGVIQGFEFTDLGLRPLHQTQVTGKVDGKKALLAQLGTTSLHEFWVCIEP